MKQFLYIFIASFLIASCPLSLYPDSSGWNSRDMQEAKYTLIGLGAFFMPLGLLFLAGGMYNKELLKKDFAPSLLTIEGQLDYLLEQQLDPEARQRKKEQIKAFRESRTQDFINFSKIIIVLSGISLLSGICIHVKSLGWI